MSFTLEGEVIQVEFITMNSVEKQLYQAWFPYNGNKIRVHVQKNATGDFKIMGDKVCPPKFLALEARIDAAIKNY